MQRSYMQLTRSIGGAMAGNPEAEVSVLRLIINFWMIPVYN